MLAEGHLMTYPHIAQCSGDGIMHVFIVGASAAHGKAYCQCRAKVVQFADLALPQ